MKRFLNFMNILAFVIYNLAFSIIVQPVFAADLSTPKSWLPTIPSLLGTNSQLPTGDLTSVTDKIIPFLISGLLYIVILLALVFLVIGGIMWITSSGDKEALAKAKSTVTYAIIGLVLGLSSFIILGLIQYFLGLGPWALGVPLMPSSSNPNVPPCNPLTGHGC